MKSYQIGFAYNMANGWIVEVSVESKILHMIWLPSLGVCVIFTFVSACGPKIGLVILFPPIPQRNCRKRQEFYNLAIQLFFLGMSQSNKEIQGMCHRT